MHKIEFISDKPRPAPRRARSDAGATKRRWRHGFAAGVDYERLLGNAAWRRLPTAVRSRFDKRGSAEKTYIGRMAVVSANAFGKLLAALGRLIGEPLAPFTGVDVPAYVRVFTEPNGGTVWERAYHFPGQNTRVIRSAKRLDGDGRLVECLGAGLHMRLAVVERNGSLVFSSDGYFLRLAGIRLPLPGRWLIGTTSVTHRDEGDGRFRFTLTIRHPVFGRVVHQDGRFEEYPS